MLRPFNKLPCFAPGELEKLSFPLAPALASAVDTHILNSIMQSSNTLAVFVDQQTPPQPQQQQQFMPPPQPQPVIQAVGTRSNAQRAAILLAQELKQLS